MLLPRLWDAVCLYLIGLCKYRAKGLQSEVANLARDAAFHKVKGNSAGE
jgi:hypothetical protein